MHGHVLLLLFVVGHLLVVLIGVSVFVAIGIFIQLRHNSHQLLTTLLEISLFALIYLSIDTVDLKFVSLHLRLVVFELRHHLFKLFATLF